MFVHAFVALEVVSDDLVILLAMWAMFEHIMV